MKTTVTNCARCGGDHSNLLFAELERPVKDMTHWSLCPVKGEPILLVMGEVGSKAGVPGHGEQGMIDLNEIVEDAHKRWDKDRDHEPREAVRLAIRSAVMVVFDKLPSHVEEWTAEHCLDTICSPCARMMEQAIEGVKR